MEKSNYMAFLQEARQFIPQERIYTDELRRLAWGTDAGFYRLIPQIVIRSEGEEEISRLLKLAGSHNLPVTFRAAGTSLSCLLYTSPSPRDGLLSRMPSSA